MQSRFTRHKTNLVRLGVEPGSCTEKKRIVKLEKEVETGESVDGNRRFSVMLNNVCVWDFPCRQTGKRSFVIRKD